VLHKNSKEQIEIGNIWLVVHFTQIYLNSNKNSQKKQKERKNFEKAKEEDVKMCQKVTNG